MHHFFHRGKCDVIQVDANSLRNYNKNNITVTPDEYFSIKLKNYDPTSFWETGCQIVLMNYQVADENG